MTGSTTLRLRTAALITGFAYLLTPTPFAEFYAMPRLIVVGDPELTAQNIGAHPTLFALAIVAYLLSYVCDTIIAWSLFYLLRPVSEPLARLASWFQLVYTAIALTASLNLVAVLRLLQSPDDMALLGHAGAVAHVRLILMSFHAVWGVSLCFFGIHLGVAGYLAYRSGYIPKAVGVALGLAGVGYVVSQLSTYLFPEPDLGYAMVLAVGELVFMCWLLIRGWRIKEPVASRVMA